MSHLITSLAVFTCILVGALVGIRIRLQLPNGTPAMMKTDADRGQAPVSQGAHRSPYRVTEARRRVDTASLSPDQQHLFS
ncbi:MAG: hypothetical protein WBW33_00550 [Bryobacteraceae bacterium]